MQVYNGFCHTERSSAKIRMGGCPARISSIRIRNPNSTRKKTNIEYRKLSQDSAKFFIKRVLSELDFAHVKVAYSTDFEVFVNNLGPNMTEAS